MIGDRIAVPLNKFIKAIEFVLDSTFFGFNNVVYKQTFGTPMESPLSPILADLVMQDVEEVALGRLPSRPLIYYRYVDDSLLISTTEDLQSIHDTFNSMHDRLRFTLEHGENGQISFLNIRIIIEDESLIFDLFHKPTFSRRFLLLFATSFK